MTFRFPLSSCAWLAVPLAAIGFIAWISQPRIQRARHVTTLVHEAPAIDAGSPTGFARGVRQLIVVEHNADTYHWIVQAQQALAQDTWRVRRVDYENAPFGHTAYDASPYRWWLDALARLEHAHSGRPPGAAVETAAVVADPILQVLLLAAAAAFAAWRFGLPTAALLAAGLATLFPFAADFLPGAADDRGLVNATALWMVLPLLAGLRGRRFDGPAPRTRVWFFIAGVAGGFGLWLNVTKTIPLLGGVASGALLAAWAWRGRNKTDTVAPPAALPWRFWALGGASATLVAYLLDYASPAVASWELRVVHPIYGFAWLGAGALLEGAAAWIQGQRPAWNARTIVVGLLAVAAVASLPLVMWKTENPAFLGVDFTALQLTKSSRDDSASDLWTWLVRDGITPKVMATALPVFVLLPAVWFLTSPRASQALRGALAVALGPALVALGIACARLGWWGITDAALLALGAAVAVTIAQAVGSRTGRWVWAGLAIVILVPGAGQLLPPVNTAAAETLSEFELMGLIDRDLAYGLARRGAASPAIVLAPPDATTTLHYYGGMPGVGTLSWENQDGLGAAVRIMSATTPEEAQSLIERRGIHYLVLPSWDSYLEEFARRGSGQVEGTFYSRLKQWQLPRWLRPIPYQLPSVPGFEGRSVAVLEVVDEQDEATAASRLAEYFVEMGQLDQAAVTAQALRRFPANFGALVARAEVETARGDETALATSLKALLPKLASGGDRHLAFDRRVGLAVVLARAKQNDLARDQVRRCYAEIDEAKLRLLTTGSLYRLQVLGRSFGLEMIDPRLRGLAQTLLPPEMRTRP